MITALNETAFSPALTPQSLWRLACPWDAAGHEEQAEWMTGMAVSLLDIRELPEVPHPHEIVRQADDFPF